MQLCCTSHWELCFRTHCQVIKSAAFVYCLFCLLCLQFVYCVLPWLLIFCFSPPVNVNTFFQAKIPVPDDLKDL